MRFAKFLPLCGALAAFLFPACTIFEPGAPSAALTVPGRSEFQVQESVDHVFTQDGYHVASRGMNTITFERLAGKLDHVVYGNWIGGEVSDRVRVTIEAKGEGKYRIRCMPSIVRDAGDPSFDDPQRSVLPYSIHLMQLLKEVRKEQQ